MKQYNNKGDNVSGDKYLFIKIPVKALVALALLIAWCSYVIYTKLTADTTPIRVSYYNVEGVGIDFLIKNKTFLDKSCGQAVIGIKSEGKRPSFHLWIGLQHRIGQRTK